MFLWQHLILGTLKLDSIFSLFKCASASKFHENSYYVKSRSAGAQRGQPLLLDAVQVVMGLFMDLKIDLLGCIRVTYG